MSSEVVLESRCKQRSQVKEKTSRSLGKMVQFPAKERPTSQAVKEQSVYLTKGGKESVRQVISRVIEKVSIRMRNRSREKRNKLRYSEEKRDSKKRKTKHRESTK